MGLIIVTTGRTNRFFTRSDRRPDPGYRRLVGQSSHVGLSGRLYRTTRIFSHKIPLPQFSGLAEKQP